MSIKKSIINDYNTIKHLDTPKNDNSWNRNIKEPYQSLEDYINMANLPNHCKNVSLRVTEKSLHKIGIEQLEILIRYLNTIYHVDVQIPELFDMNKNLEKLKNNYQNYGGYRKIAHYLLSGLNSYIINRGERISNYTDDHHKQFDATIILESINPTKTLLVSFLTFLKTKNEPTKIIAIVDNDIYMKGVHFLYGATVMNEDELVVSTYHLNEIKSFMKVVIHEFGHSLGIEHCVQHNCVLNGIGGQEDLENLLFVPCLECCAKIAFATNSTLENQLILVNNLINEGLYDGENNHILDALQFLSSQLDK